MNGSSSSLLHHAGLPRWLHWAVVVALLVLPQVLALMGLEFYTTVLTRVFIMAIAASSLNLILGYGGMVSFGHAAFVGLGAYTVGALTNAGVVSGLVAWPLAMAVSALGAAVVGGISLRTRGVYFIMITLAFAQMFYYLAISIKAWGGEDGLPLVQRSSLPFIDLKDDEHFYYLALVLCLGVVMLLQRLLNAPWGWILQGVKENETRVAALGSSVPRIQWQAFVLAGALAGLAGAMLANQMGMVSPHTLHWSQSGQLMIMVIIGGAGALWGGVLGAAVLLLLEELLSGVTLHWQLGLGLLLLAVVLLAPRGIAGIVQRRARHD